MTVPAPRGAEAGGSADETTTVLGILVATTRRIEDTVARGFDSVNLQLSRLPDTYVNLRDFDRYRNERAAEWVDAKKQHDRDIDELKVDAEKRAEQARTFRHWLIGTGSTACLGMAAIAVEIILQHH